MKELTGFGMKEKLTLLFLASKYFNIIRDETDETIFTLMDECLRFFVRKIIKSGRCAALNQHLKPIIAGEVFLIFQLN